MKKNLFFILLLLPLTLAAQDRKYEDLVREMRSQSPNVAFYNYQKFQKQSPEVGNVYFQMGMISYDYLKKVNPITDYTTFKYYAYNAKLYFQSALHFANNAEIRKHAEFYPILSEPSKKLDYGDLKSFIDSRLDTIENLTVTGVNLYETYSKLASNYDRCISLFYQFNEKYSKVNEALLLVDEFDIEKLEQLKVESDSLAINIESYLDALTDYKIEGYNPQFVFFDIDLYRVDGLCSADFFANKVILYNYSKWVDAFLNKYRRVDDLRNKAIDVYSDLLLKKQIYPSAALVNALYQIDANSYPATMLVLLGLSNRSEAFAVEFNQSVDLNQKIMIASKMFKIASESEENLFELNNLVEADYLKYLQFNKKYLDEDLPYDLLKLKVDAIGDRCNDVLSLLKEEVDSLSDGKKDVDVLAGNIDYLSMLEEPNATILYVYRYQQNMSYVFYVLDDKLYIKEVVF